jgi:hypothetical protein
MAFYNAPWVRKLLKEDHNNIRNYLNVRDKDTGKFVNDLRAYIDSTIPFTLYLDIGEIKERVLDKGKELIRSIAVEAYPESLAEHGSKQIYSMLLKAYKTVINDYIDNTRYTETTTEELNALLNGSVDAAGNITKQGLNQQEFGKIKTFISSEFKKTRRLTSLSKKNSRVCLIFPKFNTVDFNAKFRAALDFNMLDGDLENGVTESPARKVRKIFADTKRQVQTKLQNVGHIEVDVVSTIPEKREVKRSQLSPRFIQALIATPNNNRELLKVSKQFSKETKQSTTRLKVRKQFSDKRLVMELLVESNMMVGLPESQKDNLDKAAKERGFSIGANISDAIRKDASILADLETSKSLKQFVVSNTLNILEKGKGIQPYNSLSQFNEALSIPILNSSIKVAVKTKPTKSVNTPTVPKRLSYANDKDIGILTRLPILINQALMYQIKKNMGDGTRRDVLNYRSGRFASSAKVEKMSESRQGMLTAYYSYMKYPYATFSKGGRQESPRSRDPKLLISKSIREIAQTLVSNTLRAVNV